MRARSTAPRTTIQHGRSTVGLWAASVLAHRGQGKKPELLHSWTAGQGRATGDPLKRDARSCCRALPVIRGPPAVICSHCLIIVSVQLS